MVSATYLQGPELWSSPVEFRVYSTHKHTALTASHTRISKTEGLKADNNAYCNTRFQHPQLVRTIPLYD